MEFASIEELSHAASQPLGRTPWQRISQVEVQAFADLTGDQQWIHTDPARAATEGPFGGPIVHGALLLALVPVFTGALLQVRDSGVVVNGGVERARFRTPVPVGARIRGSAELREVTPMGQRVSATVRTTVEVEGQPRAACTADQVMVFS